MQSDNDILVVPLYELHEQRRFRKVPIIYGSTTDEGTDNVDKTVTTAALKEAIRDTRGNITDSHLEDLPIMYPESLNSKTFLGALLNATYLGAGNEWERLAAMMSDITIRCIAVFHSDMHYDVGNELNRHYHYNVLDTRGEWQSSVPHSGIERNLGAEQHRRCSTPGYHIPDLEGGVLSIVEIMQNYWD